MANVKNAKKKNSSNQKDNFSTSTTKITVKNAIKETDKAVLAGNKDQQKKV